MIEFGFLNVEIQEASGNVLIINMYKETIFNIRISNLHN
jgi:hypothetical protein